MAAAALLRRCRPFKIPDASSIGHAHGAEATPAGAESESGHLTSAQRKGTLFAKPEPVDADDGDAAELSRPNQKLAPEDDRKLLALVEDTGATSLSQTRCSQQRRERRRNHESPEFKKKKNFTEEEVRDSGARAPSLRRRQWPHPRPAPAPPGAPPPRLSSRSPLLLSPRRTGASWKRWPSTGPSGR